MAAHTAKCDVSWAQLVTPLVFLTAIAGALVVNADLVIGGPDGDALVRVPQTIEIAPRTFRYRAPGAYSRGGLPVDAPMLTVLETRTLTIMKYQVSKGDYARCVADGACSAPEPEFPAPDEVDAPVTGISFTDASAYASWLSRRTGEVWTLPTYEQLAFAAGSRFPDDALGTDTSSSNPAVRWIATYRREATRKVARDPLPKPIGAFGENEFGLADFGGNVWEWTTTCHHRVDLDRPQSAPDEFCGNQLVAGRHRAVLVFFVRNAKAGACAVGAPPDNLGFRLVKDTRWYAPLVAILRQNGLLT